MNGLGTFEHLSAFSVHAVACEDQDQKLHYDRVGLLKGFYFEQQI